MAHIYFISEEDLNGSRAAEVIDILRKALTGDPFVNRFGKYYLRVAVCDDLGPDWSGLLTVQTVLCKKGDEGPPFDAGSKNLSCYTIRGEDEDKDEDEMWVFD